MVFVLVTTDDLLSVVCVPPHVSTRSEEAMSRNVASYTFP